MENALNITESDFFENNWHHSLCLKIKLYLANSTDFLFLCQV